MPDRFNVLFICADNSARSIIAEVLLNRFGEDRFRAYSAGLYPAPEVDPLALALLASSGFPIAGIRSKTWREFCSPDAPRIDFVVSLCESAASQVVVPGDPIFAFWRISDPHSFADEAARGLAFRRAMRELENRVRLFALLRHPVPVNRPELAGSA